MKKRIWPGLTAAAAFAADRITKILAKDIPEGGQTLIPGVVGLRYTENKGIAFSMLSGVPWLTGTASLLIIAAAFWFLRKRKLHPLTLVGLMLMLGGAAGNMADRFVLGCVPDMIELLFVRFAVFNVADACLCTGCGLVILALLLNRESIGSDGQERKAA